MDEDSVKQQPSQPEEKTAVVDKELEALKKKAEEELRKSSINVPLQNQTVVETQPGTQLPQPTVETVKPPSVIPQMTEPPITEPMGDKPEGIPKLVLMIAIFLFVVSLGGFGFFLLSNKLGGGGAKPTLTPEAIITPEPVVVPTSTPDITADWKEYKDAASKYSFRYPSDFTETPYNEGNSKGVSIGFLGKDQIRTQAELIDGIVIKTLLIVNSTKTAKVFAEEMKKTEEESSKTANRKNVVSAVEVVEIGGVDGYQYKISGDENGITVYIQLGGDILRISSTFASAVESQKLEYVNTIDQILSTFKFTQNLVSSPTPSLKSTATPSASPKASATPGL